MRTKKIQPGYRVEAELHEKVTAYAKELTGRNGFPVSINTALSLIIKQGLKELSK